MKKNDVLIALGSRTLGDLTERIRFKKKKVNIYHVDGLMLAYKSLKNKANDYRHFDMETIVDLIDIALSNKLYKGVIFADDVKADLKRLKHKAVKLKNKLS